MEKALGRPTGYTYQLAQQICERLSTTDRGLQDICGDNDMPGKSTVWRWLSQYPEFWEMYTRAREFQTEIMYDEMERIALEPLPETDVFDLLGNNVGSAVNGSVAMAEVQRRKLIIDVIKFKLAKLQPKRFGDNKNMSIDVKVRHSVSTEQFNKIFHEAGKALLAEPTEDIDHEEIEDDEDLM